MRAAVMTAPSAPIAIQDLPVPDLAPGAILLETIASEVCGTDVHLWHGRLAGVPYPIVPGHVAVGRIAAFGPGTTDADRPADFEGRPFAAGNVVTFLDVHGTCGACWYCLVARQSTRCPKRRVYGITLGVSDGPSGGWAEAIVLRPGTRLLRLPAGLDPETYIGGGCGAVTAFHAVRRGGVRLGDAVVVLGAGPVGLSAAAFAALSGADPVVVIGAPADRLAMAGRMGATMSLDLDRLPHAARRDAVLACTGGRGADVVIEAAGVPKAVAEGATLCRDGGVMVVAGHYTDGGEVPFNPHALVNRPHLEVRGCWGSDASHFDGAIRAMARHQTRVPFAEMVTRWYPIEKSGEALQAVADRAVLKAGIRPERLSRA
jgi:threonine dehydrogenase-like Zn-dependent dehydrogenase